MPSERVDASSFCCFCLLANVTHGKLTSMGLGSWSESVGYDSALRPNVFTSPAGAFTYNFNGAARQVASLQTPGGTASYTYNGAGEVTQIQFKNSGLTVLDSHAYTHDGRGMVPSVTRLSGAMASFGYDPVGQLTSAHAQESDSTPRLNEQFNYTYDASGNLAARTNNTLTQTFSSDSRDQLSSLSRSGTLTAAGSLTGTVGSVQVNGVDAAVYGDGTYATTSGITLRNGTNVLVPVVRNSGGTMVLSTVMKPLLPSTASFTYDTDGNLTGDGFHAYAYDDSDQLTNVTVAGGWKSDFVYDGLGCRRIARDYAWLGSWSLTN